MGGYDREEGGCFTQSVVGGRVMGGASWEKGEASEPATKGGEDENG